MFAATLLYINIFQNKKDAGGHPFSFNIINLLLIFFLAVDINAEHF